MLAIGRCAARASKLITHKHSPKEQTLVVLLLRLPSDNQFSAWASTLIAHKHSLPERRGKTHGNVAIVPGTCWTRAKERVGRPPVCQSRERDSRPTENVVVERQLPTNLQIERLHPPSRNRVVDEGRLGTKQPAKERREGGYASTSQFDIRVFAIYQIMLG